MHLLIANRCLGVGGGVGFEILWVFRYDAATSF